MQRMRRIRIPLGKNAGFTVAELVVVIVVLGIIFPIFIALLLSSYKDTFLLDDKVKTGAEATQALWYMEENVRVSSEFLATVPSQYSDPYGPHNSGTSGGEAWSYKGDSSTRRVLITRSYATTANALNTGRQPVFMDTPAFSCSTQMYYQPQLSFVTIYFVRDNTLYRRILTDTTSALCPGNTQQQKQTCPPSVPIGSRPASCKANDEVLATHVGGFELAYYQIGSGGISTQIDPSYTSTDPTVLAAADYVNVTITTSTWNGVQIDTISQRMTKVNQ